MVVSVLLAVLMFHGCVQMKERCCKYSCQEGPTEYCRYRANSSHHVRDAMAPDPRSQRAANPPEGNELTRNSLTLFDLTTKVARCRCFPKRAG